MKHPWGKPENHIGDDENGGQKTEKYTEFRPKLYTKVPLQKAIDNYNSISTMDDNTQGYDNFSFIPENGDNYESNVSTMSSTKPLNNVYHRWPAEIRPSDDFGDFSTIRSKSSVRTDASPKASTNKLDVSPKLKDKCNTCLGYVETISCLIGLACGLGNVFGLPQSVLSGGGLPFLVAYVVLAVVVGLPLLTLEIGLGQIAQEGFMKTWRAVPFFRGIGYIKLIAGYLLALCYSIYMALSVYYIIWYAQGMPPFENCIHLRMKEKKGYETEGISGQQCIKKTFLKDPFVDPYWYGIFLAILFCIWLITSIWLFRRTKTYVVSLIIYFVITIGCLIALIVKAAQFSKVPGLERFDEEADWTILGTADVWYHAAIQVFYSTFIGFGVFVTNAGVIFKKVNPIWTTFGYMLANLIVGVVAVLLVYIFAHEINEKSPAIGDVRQVHLLTLIYDITLSAESTESSWAYIAYFFIAFAGFISVTTLMYIVLKAITLEMRTRWWKPNVVCCAGGFILCGFILLAKHFQIVHLFDYYVIGNLILISVLIEVFAFIYFYGHKRLQSDFEFIVGYKIPVPYVVSWYLSPIVLFAVFIWKLATIASDEILKADPIWLYTTGWVLVALSVLFILMMGLYYASKLDEYYVYSDKFRAAFKFSRKWGPVDPIMRYNWVQWHSKAKDGERDFTLKRRGTRDYTHSAKKHSKNNAKKYTVAAETDSSMNTDSIAFRKSDQNQNNITLMNLKNYGEPYPAGANFHPTHLPIGDDKLRITSLVDTFDTPRTHQSRRGTYGGEDSKTTHNPLAHLSKFEGDCGQSEGYGTFRNGPYVIDPDEIEHVCHRRIDYLEEEATVL